MTTTTAAETDWPDFMPILEPGLSASPVAAAIPQDIVIEPPPPALPPAAARWSGVWSGWGGQGAIADVKLIVENLTAEGASVVCVRAAQGVETLTERLQARFADDELQGTLSSGTRVSYRLRNADTMEFHWRAGSGAWMVGVLAKTDPDSAMSVERVPTDFSEDGNAVTLETVIFKPPGDGPFPALLFNHGSTGSGNDPALMQSTWVSPALARFFTERGWLVAFPQRRGRGGSGGSYREGLELDGSGYSVRPEISLPGVERALTDIDAAVAWLQTRPDVDPDRLLIGGQSRGGALALAYAGTRPQVFRGALNFVGGWIGDAAADAESINGQTFRRGAAFDKPTLWLYADNDPFYRIEHSRNNFAAFTDAGGSGAFQQLPIGAGQNGHFIVSAPELWGDLVERYLAALR